MAVTGFWPVFKNLKATLDYADNPDKTTAPEYLDEDLYAALRYAENDDILHKNFVIRPSQMPLPFLCRKAPSAAAKPRRMGFRLTKLSPAGTIPRGRKLYFKCFSI